MNDNSTPRNGLDLDALFASGVNGTLVPFSPAIWGDDDDYDDDWDDSDDDESESVTESTLELYYGVRDDREQATKSGVSELAERLRALYLEGTEEDADE